MSKTRKQLELPSGAVCRVRRFSMFDLRSLGDMPTAFTVVDEKGETTSAESDFGTRLARLALIHCVSPLLGKDGSKVSIVDKPFHELGDDELSVEEVDTADALAIVNAVCELSGFGKEAAVAAQPFSEQPKPAAGG